jgi:hypothetical protein
MWTRHGWKRTTIAEVSLKHPGGSVSSHSGLFMCELCHQNVALATGDKRRYFKHSSSEADKSCPERTFNSSSSLTFNAKDYELPIKIITNRNDFRFELGLLYVPEAIINCQAIQSVRIKPFHKEAFSYSFERLNLEGITYLPIGQMPSSEYKIFAPEALMKYWPRKVKGVDQNGSIFDYFTGKMLCRDSDTQVQKKYYLLTTDSLRDNRVSSIRVNIACKKNYDNIVWYLYVIKALELDQEAADFFLSFHCRLTDEPLRIHPIWPVHIETPYVIKHFENYTIMHLSGGRSVTQKTFPSAPIQKFQCKTGEQVVKITCNDRQQLISLGDTNILEYFYLWKEKLDKSTISIDIDVQDGAGAIIENGEHINLPDAGIIKILAPYDGYVIKYRENHIVEKRKLVPNIQLIIDGVTYGLKIKILQGLDIVWQVSFCKRKQSIVGADEQLFRKLNNLKGYSVRVPHSFGAVAEKLRGYPKTKDWIYSTVKNGFANQDAIKYLRKYVFDLSHQ